LATIVKIAIQVIAVCGIYIILEAILSIRYHYNIRSRIAHLGRISRIIAGAIIIVMAVII